MSATQVSAFECLVLSIDVGQSIQYAQQNQCWVILVCPEPRVTHECLRQLSTQIPKEAKFSGRTAVCSQGARISVVDAQDDVFMPRGTQFVVDFVGWTAKHDAAGMLKWQNNSSGKQRTVQTD